MNVCVALVLCGSHNSQIATLVERQTLYVMLMKVAGKDTETVINALIKEMLVESNTKRTLEPTYSQVQKQLQSTRRTTIYQRQQPESVSSPGSAEGSLL